jgi:AcrR family transcriptional regulator
VNATGLGRGSLYGAFGNKTQLFVRAVDHYRAMVARLVATPSDLKPRAALEAMFAAIIDKNATPGGPAGCLLTNTCTEFATISPEAREHVLAGLRDMHDAFGAVLAEGRRRGQLDPGADTGQLASFFVAVHQAVAVLAASGASRDVLEGVVAVGLGAWPDPPLRARSSRN